jgi:hypothetical protein
MNKAFVLAVRTASKLPPHSKKRVAALRAALLERSGGGKPLAVVRYKGKPYNMVWRGKTPYGERAKLQFMDGSKEFWVDVAQIEESPRPGTRGVSPLGGKCRGCGGAIRNAPHQKAEAGYCGWCAYDEL